MTVIDRRYSVAEGVAIKAPVRVATTANIALSGLQAIDGVTVAEHDRVLVWQQTDQRANGIYEASSGNWQRTKDFDGALDVVEGTRVFATQGALYADTEFMVSTAGVITIGTSNIAFEEFVSTSVALAEAAADRAETAADIAVATVTTLEFADVASAEAATIPDSVDTIRTLGMDTRGNETPATWKEVGSAPSHGAYLEDAGGRIFEIWIKYTPPNIMQFGGSVYSADDNTPALLKMLKYCQAKSLKWCQVPAGHVFKTWPGDLGQYGDIHIEGAGREKTILYVDYDEATGLQGFLHFTTGHPKITGMTIVPIQGRTCGCAMTFKGVSGIKQPDTITIQDVRVTSGTPDGWVCCINFDGTAKDGSDGYPHGVRNSYITDLELFGAGLFTARLVSVRGFNWHGGISIRDTGTGPGSGDLFIGGTSAVPSTLVNMSLSSIAGNLILDQIETGMLRTPYVGGDITNTSTVHKFLTQGYVEGSVQNNWLESQHIGTMRDDGTDGTWTWRDLGNRIFKIWRSASLTSTPTDFAYPAAFGSFGVVLDPVAVPQAAVAVGVTPSATKVTAVSASNVNCIIGAYGVR